MENICFTGIDHVQLAIPSDGEDLARGFYSAILGMNEVAKPPELAKRGGCWFESGSVQIHLGVEEDFRPAKKAHLALRCSDYLGVIDSLLKAGVTVNEATDIPDVRRFHIHDPFRNRIEIIEDRTKRLKL